MTEITPPIDQTMSVGRSSPRWALGALMATAAASVVLSLNAWAAGDEPASAPRMMPPAGMMQGAGSEMGMMPFGGRHLQRMLDDAKVDDVQRTQIRQIMDKAQADLKALHDEGHALRDQGLKLWTAPTLDANAAEKLRQQMLAHHDRVSKRMMLAMLDVGRVLKPEQRAVIGQQMARHHEDMMRRMQGRHGHHGSSERQPGGQ